MANSKQKKEEETKTQTAPRANGQAEKGKGEASETALSQLDLRFRDEIAGHPGGENIRRGFAFGTCAAG